MTKFSISLFALLGIFTLTSCGNEALEVTVTADKTTLAVGETITFTAAVNSSDYNCADWRIYETGASQVAAEIIDPTSSATYTFTPTAAGTYRCTFAAGYACDADFNAPEGELDKDIFEGSFDFTVTE